MQCPISQLVFYAMLDIAALNAYVIWTEANPGWPSSSTSALRHSRKTFLKTLSKELCMLQIRRYATELSLQSGTKTAIQIVVGHSECELDPPSTSQLCAETGRCYMCITETHGAGHKKKKFNLNSRV